MRKSTPSPDSIFEAVRRAMTGPTGPGVITSLAIVIVAGVVAPGDGPGLWTWIRVLAIWLLLSLSLGTIVAVGTGDHPARRATPALVWGALALVVLIALTFDVLTLSLTVLGVVLLLLTVPTSHHALTFWAVVVMITPLWVWSAFEAWDRWLLMLVPMAIVGLISLEHAVRAGHAGGSLPETMAAWVGLVALAGIALLVTLLGPIDPSWSTSAALAVAILATIDLLVARIQRPSLSPVVLPAIALVIIAFSWMAAL